MNKEKIIERNNQIDLRLSDFWKVQREIRKNMVEAIHDMVSEMKEVEVDWENEDDYPIITYDGGNHPEYNSTISASVGAVHATTNKNDGSKSFSVNLDDENDYEQNRMEFADVAQVFEYVCAKYEEFVN